MNCPNKNDSTQSQIQNDLILIFDCFVLFFYLQSSGVMLDGVVVVVVFVVAALGRLDEAVPPTPPVPWLAPAGFMLLRLAARAHSGNTDNQRTSRGNTNSRALNGLRCPAAIVHRDLVIIVVVVSLLASFLCLLFSFFFFFSSCLLFDGCACVCLISDLTPFSLSLLTLSKKKEVFKFLSFWKSQELIFFFFSGRFGCGVGSWSFWVTQKVHGSIWRTDKSRPAPQKKKMVAFFGECFGRLFGQCQMIHFFTGFLYQKTIGPLSSIFSRPKRRRRRNKKWGRRLVFKKRQNSRRNHKTPTLTSTNFWINSKSDQN